MNAVSLKLPEFWKKSPEVWFARVEAQFNTKSITADQTKYDYIVSTMDIDTADEMQAILIHPPVSDKYETLKKALVKTYGKSQLRKDFELLSLNGLGDRSPTTLMRKITALNNDPKTLKTALFLANLPSDMRTILLSHDLSSLEELAEAADRIWEAQRTSIQQVDSTNPPIAAVGQPSDNPNTVEAVSSASKVKQRISTHGKSSNMSAGTPSVCFYHLRFGPNARRCQPGCKFASLLSGKQPNTVAAVASQRNTLSVWDKKTGSSYLVDTGADVSVYPASLQERKSSRLTEPLSAANGTAIKTWGKRLISLNLGQDEFKHEFQVADVSRAILGADFFIKHGLFIDLKGRRLLSKDRVSITLTSTSAPISLAGLSFTSSNTYTDLLQQFPELLVPRFDTSVNKHGVEHHIVTQGPPVHARARRLDNEKLTAVKEEFLKMEKMGIIRRSKSPWSSPLHVVPKSDGSWRPCGDYRHLNAASEDDRYPLPHIQDFNNWLANSKVFSKVDLVRGYHQIPMAAASIPKTAIITPFGLWEFLRMPFGLKNAGQAFQRLMDGVLRDVPFAFAYLDDILVASESHDDHHKHLKLLFQLLSANGLVLNKSKCVFGANELDFLGHRVTAQGIMPLPDRITALRECSAPTNRAGLQRFLGLINYYHRFIPHVAQVLAPLHAQASGKGQSINWTEECQDAFEKVKESLSKVALLHHPRPDAQTSLTVDASNTAMGAQLEQRTGKDWYPIAFFSRKLSEAEKKYSAFDRELLAAYAAIKHFKHFLEGRQFTLFTDHKPLTTAISSQTDRSPRQTRHLSYISEFTTNIQHLHGKYNVVADAFSRLNSLDMPNQTSQESSGTPSIKACASIQKEIFTARDFKRLAADQRQSGEMDAYLTANTGLQLEYVMFGDTAVLCDTTYSKPRPILPSSWTRPMFDAVHGLSHPGPRPTQKAISQLYVWEGMKRDIREWCRDCHACQSSKFHRHTHAPLLERPAPTARFRSIHIDLVGPLPVSQGMSYLLTIIDRFTRWPEVIPLPDAQTVTCASALLHHWIARFGVPENITSDRGAQFTSTLWSEFNKLLGITVHHTTAYHPQANGMVERLHRQLKASLKARSTSPNWFAELPMVLLGIRSSWRVDPGCSPAELVYGTTLILPGEFLQPVDKVTMEPDTAFVKQLQRTMRSIQPTPPQYHGTQRAYVPSNLASTGYVYVRHDGYRQPLQRPYDGPFRIISTSDKYFVLDIKGRNEKVSVDRLKAAFVKTPVPQTNSTTPATRTQATAVPQQQQKPELPAAAKETPPVITTRCGRLSKPPNRL